MKTRFWRRPLYWFIATKVLSLALWFSQLPWIVAVLVYAAADAWVLWNMFVPTASGLLPVYSRFQTPRREVWLTIDDGPDPVDTPKILELLSHYSATATFFLIGEKAQKHPELVRLVVERGHTIGHHTHTHPEASFWCAGSRRIEKELTRGSAALASAGCSPVYFRPPVGIKTPFLGAALRKHNLRCLAWSVRSGDSFASEPQPIVRDIMRVVKAGDIILLHEGPRLAPAVRVHVIENLLSELTMAGYRCVLPEPDSLR